MRDFVFLFFFLFGVFSFSSELVEISIWLFLFGWWEKRWTIEREFFEWLLGKFSVLDRFCLLNYSFWFFDMWFPVLKFCLVSDFECSVWLVRKCSKKLEFFLMLSFLNSFSDDIWVELLWILLIDLMLTLNCLQLVFFGKVCLLGKDHRFISFFVLNWW